jgi:hypothetical protein
MARVAHDTDHRGKGFSLLDALADRAPIRPQRSRHGLVDDHDRRRISRVCIGEVAAVRIGMLIVRK